MRTKSQRGDGHLLEGDLIAAATRLLGESTPPAAPSLRAVARECGVSPSAVYLHFASQEQLARAVVTSLFADLRRSLAEVDDLDADPQVRLTEMGRAYVRWAQANPGGYQLLFEAPDPEAPADEQWAPGVDLLQSAATCFERVHADGPTAAQYAGLLWACWHGIVTLRRTKPAAPWTTTVDEDLTTVVGALMARYRDGSAYTAVG